MAGESEEVPGVVDEFVHDGAVAEHRRRALVHADEVEDQQGEEGGGIAGIPNFLQKTVGSSEKY